MAPRTRSKRKRQGQRATNLQPPPPPGGSNIERLPIEILHHIHFLCPSNLPLCSSTLLQCFSPPNLPVYPTVRYLISLPSFALLTSNALRAHWFLSRAYVRDKAYVAAFVRIVYLVPGALHANTLLSEPPFDPWLFFQNDDTTLPSSLVHFIYHTYPTLSDRLAEVALRDLVDGRIERAEQLFAVGAVPSHAPAELVTDVSRARLVNVPGVSSTYPSERLLAWKIKEARRTKCSCGFDAGAAAASNAKDSLLAAPLESHDSANSDDGPQSGAKSLQERILSKFGDKNFGLHARLVDGMEEEQPRRGKGRILIDLTGERVVDWVSAGICKIMHYWMLPFNGTVAKYPTDLADVKRTVYQRTSSCQHQDPFTRAFLVAYVTDLRRRLL